MEAREKLAETNPESDLCTTPVLKDFESTFEDDDLKNFSDIFATASPLAQISWGSVREAFFNHMQPVVYGRTDPYQAGEDLHEQLQSITDDIIPEPQSGN